MPCDIANLRVNRDVSAFLRSQGLTYVAILRIGGKRVCLDEMRLFIFSESHTSLKSKVK